MAQESWPSPAVGREVTDYQFEQMARAWGGSGLIGLPTVLPLVYADSTGLKVKVRAFREAQVSGFHWYSGDTDFELAISPNLTGVTRRDLVVLGLDRSTFDVTIYVRTGTTVVPALNQSTAGTGTWEMAVAQVDVAASAASIAAGNVTALGWYKTPPMYTARTGTTPLGIFSESPGQLRYQYDTGVLEVSAGNSLTPWKTIHHDSNAGRGLIYAFRGGAATGLPAHTGTWMAARNIPVMPSRSLRLSLMGAARTTASTFGSVSAYVLISAGQQVTAGTDTQQTIPANAYRPIAGENLNYVTGSSQTTLSNVTGQAVMAGAGTVNLDNFVFTVTDIGPAVPYVTV